MFSTEILILILILDPEVCYQMRGHQSLEHDCDDEFDVLNKTAQRWQRHVASLSDHDCLSQVCYIHQLFLLLKHFQVLLLPWNKSIFNNRMVTLL